MTERPTILIVDDAPANIDLLKGILRETYKIKAATSGEKALHIAAKTPAPDLILLDVMMPGMGGHETCRQLKADPATAAIPILFVTGHANAAEHAKGLTLGALDTLVKPIDPERLLERVASVLKA
ncbi:response regulator [Thiocystis violascens]|uniref:Response regulator containing a CheY-like receiver domain and an HD-GYP domain n=1 Tax=Thiocystis violascens (strain ATCC 17096 / DSM 198 / 6111) TaxID=765911 RepID=I3Y8B0_THIV6|nr:response regulator [Thiocystis violascens]AFL73228.1 response regulator containing a CheY-like receiver domain and an HD-GYP domain [Thiocystis violascens DSM 198]